MPRYPLALVKGGAGGASQQTSEPPNTPSPSSRRPKRPVGSRGENVVVRELETFLILSLEDPDAVRNQRQSWKEDMRPSTNVTKTSRPGLTEET